MIITTRRVALLIKPSLSLKVTEAWELKPGTVFEAEGCPRPFKVIDQQSSGTYVREIKGKKEVILRDDEGEAHTATFSADRSYVICSTTRVSRIVVNPTE